MMKFKKENGKEPGNVCEIKNKLAVDVTNLTNLAAQFHGQKTAPRTAIAGRAGQTTTLPPTIKSITSILRNRLDKQMVLFKKSNPEFYAGYLAARVIVDRGGGGGSTPVPSAPATPAK